MRKLSEIFDLFRRKIPHILLKLIQPLEIFDLKPVWSRLEIMSD